MLISSRLRIISRFSSNHLLRTLRRSHNKVGVLGVPFDKGQVIYNFLILSVTSDCMCNTDFVDCDAVSFNF
jgi:hypothetical protein